MINIRNRRISGTILFIQNSLYKYVIGWEDYVIGKYFIIIVLSKNNNDNNNSF